MQMGQLNRIFARLFAARPQSLAVIGDRQMGKTTLLQQISTETIFQNFIPANVNPLFLHYDIQKTGIVWQNLIEAICEDLASATNYPINSTDYYHEIQELVKQYQERYRFYLLFDNFELLTQSSQVPLEFYSYLRSLANSFMIAYVTASRASLQSLCVRRDICESPFFNIFTNLELKGFSEAETKELVSLMAPHTDYKDCYRICAGHPGLTVKWLRRLATSPCELNEFIIAETDYLQVLSSQFDSETCSVLRAIAKGQTIRQPQRFISETLRRKGYLNQSGKLASAALELHLLQGESKESKSLFHRLFKK